MFAHKEAKIPWEKTQACVQNSFTAEDWSDMSTNNTLIDEEISYWKEYGTGLFPSIVINNQTFRGQFET